jgi:hypothetical protein
MSFNNQKNVTRTADALSFTARITVGVNVCRADISYKPTFRVGPPSITATTVDGLMAALARQDKTVKFYLTDANAGTLSAKDAATLDALKNDPHTSDAMYRTACKSFGQKPQPRNVTANAVASTANLPQGAPTLRASAEAWMAFEIAHAELFTGVFAASNLTVIEQWFADEKVQWTADSLAQCYRELKAANCFRAANILTRGIHGALQIVKPYSHQRIVAMRDKQVVEAANAAPAHLSDVDRDVWNAVKAKYPQLPVNSAGFKKCCADTLILWATDFVKEQQPQLAAANRQGELRKAVDTTLMQWARMSNSNIGQSNSKAGTKIWLG